MARVLVDKETQRKLRKITKRHGMKKYVIEGTGLDYQVINRALKSNALIEEDNYTRIKSYLLTK